MDVHLREPRGQPSTLPKARPFYTDYNPPHTHTPVVLSENWRCHPDLWQPRRSLRVPGRKGKGPWCGLEPTNPKVRGYSQEMGSQTDISPGQGSGFEAPSDPDPDPHVPPILPPELLPSPFFPKRRRIKMKRRRKNRFFWTNHVIRRTKKKEKQKQILNATNRIKTDQNEMRNGRKGDHRTGSAVSGSSPWKFKGSEKISFLAGSSPASSGASGFRFSGSSGSSFWLFLGRSLNFSSGSSSPKFSFSWSNSFLAILAYSST